MPDPIFSMGPSGDLSYTDQGGRRRLLKSTRDGAALADLMAAEVTEGSPRQILTFAVSITPAATGANTSAEQTFNTFTGLLTTDVLLNVIPPSAPTAGLSGPTQARISGANTIALTWGNHTAGGLTAPAGVYTVVVMR